MEKTIRHSLKILLNPTIEQQKDLRRRMCYSHNFVNQLIHLNRRTEYLMDEECKKLFPKEWKELSVNIEKFKKEKNDKIDKIKLEMKQKGVSNNKKKMLKNQIGIEILKYKKLVYPYYKEWSEKTKEIKKEKFYLENNLWKWFTISKFCAQNPRGGKIEAKSTWFTTDDIDKNNIKNIGSSYLWGKIGRKIMSSVETIIKIRAKGKPASMVKYNETKIKEEDKIYQEGNKKKIRLIVIDMGSTDMDIKALLEEKKIPFFLFSI